MGTVFTEASIVHPENPLNGTSQGRNAVSGYSNSGIGVAGWCTGFGGNDLPKADGVFGAGKNGVHGQSASPTDSGVWGENTGKGAGVSGSSISGSGVFGLSQGWDGVHGESKSNLHAGVSGINTAGGFGVWAFGKIAGHFEGDVEVTGDIRLSGGDCAEQFDAAGADMCEPGTVMVLDGTGALLPSGQEYDRRVAGVVSGAGKFRPALVLDTQPDIAHRVTIALVGKVYCKAVATERPIEVGDLLTTSPVEGHAMKATDQMRAFGAIIGKALQPLPSGTGLIPVLIALQ